MFPAGNVNAVGRSGPYQSFSAFKVTVTGVMRLDAGQRGESKSGDLICEGYRLLV